VPKSEADGPITDLERRELSRGCKGLMGVLVILASLLIVGSIKILMDRQRVETTRQRLSDLVQLFHKHPITYRAGESSPGDPTRLVELQGLIGTMNARLLFKGSEFEHAESGTYAMDAWDHNIYYRCPGPIHIHGYDLISCGPNGVYENGQGDDIVVGENLPDEMRIDPRTSDCPVCGRKRPVRGECPFCGVR